MLQASLDDVRQRIRQACERSGRAPSAVTLVGVTKGLPAAVIQEAMSLGLTDLGENRVQEARERRAQLGSVAASVRWHLIGHLQRNKAKDAVELFSLIHSVDSVELVEELERQAAKRGRTLEILLQVNVAAEASKFGCRPDVVGSLAAAVGQCRQLALKGLMAIAPFSHHAEDARPHFSHLRRLRDQLQMTLSREPTGQPANRPTRLLLSMGMSNDFEVAIEEGADLVRIGTAIFGIRGMGHGAGE